MSAGIEQFGRDLVRLIERASQEYDLTYAEIVGTMQFRIHALINRAIQDEEEKG